MNGLGVQDWNSRLRSGLNAGVLSGRDGNARLLGVVRRGLLRGVMQGGGRRCVGMHLSVRGGIGLVGSGSHGVDELEAIDIRPGAEHPSQRHADGGGGDGVGVGKGVEKVLCEAGEIPATNVLDDGVHEIEKGKLHGGGGIEDALLDDGADGICGGKVLGGDGGELVDDLL